MKKTILFLMVILGITLVYAGGDNAKLYFTDGTLTLNGTDICTNDGTCLTDTAGAAGDITSVQNGTCLTGGADTGAVTLTANIQCINDSLSGSYGGGVDTNTNIIDDNLYNTTQLQEQTDGKLGIVLSWMNTLITNLITSYDYYTGTEINSSIDARASSTDGTGGWVNDSATTSTTLAVNVTGTVDIHHTSISNNDHSLEIDTDAAGFGDVKAIDIVYTTGAITTGDDEGIILINIDESLATGGDVFGVEVLATEGSAHIDGLKVGALVNPIHQDSGTFMNMSSATVDETNTLGAFSTSENDTPMFVSDNDNITIGDSSKFEELEFLLNTTASGSGITPIFYYSTGIGTWDTFNPVDGTNGMRNNGIVAWEDADIPSWATGTGTEYLIRIQRTKNALSTVPIEDKVQISAITEYYWNSTGDLSVNTVTADSWSDAECIKITGSAGLCDGDDAIGSGGNTTAEIWAVADNGTYQYNISNQACTGSDKISSYADGVFTCTADAQGSGGGAGVLAVYDSWIKPNITATGGVDDLEVDDINITGTISNESDTYTLADFLLDTDTTYTAGSNMSLVGTVLHWTSDWSESIFATIANLVDYPLKTDLTANITTLRVELNTNIANNATYSEATYQTKTDTATNMTSLRVELNNNIANNATYSAITYTQNNTDLKTQMINVTNYNITDVKCITFTSGGKVCGV